MSYWKAYEQMMTNECCGRPMIAVEVRGEYDGALFWECAECGLRVHRHPPGSWQRERAEPYVKQGTTVLDDGSPNVD